MNYRFGSRWVSAVCCLVTLSTVPNLALAEKADTIRLLPQNTYAYVSIANAPELADKFMQTGFGLMLQDDGLRPVLQQLFDELENVASPLTDQIGLTLADMSMIPQGEVTLAVFEQGTGLEVGFAVFVEVNEQMLAVQQMLDRADEEFTRGDRTQEIEEFDGVDIIYYDMPGNEDFVYFERDGILVISNSLPAAREFLSTWDTGRSDGFHTNRTFATVVDRSRGPRGKNPQATWFVDPISLIKRGSDDNFVFNNILDSIGLNGLKGAGGGILFATEDYDTFSQTHVIMDHPRPGVLNVLAFEAGDGTPDPWIPADVSAYMSVNFNVQDGFFTVADLVNRFQGEGALELQAANAFRQLNLDFESDVLPAFGNRFSYSTWIQKPVTISSQGQVLGVKLTDGDAFKPTFDKIVERIMDSANLQEKTFAGKTYYALEFGFRPQGGFRQSDQERNPFGAEAPTPCFMLLNDYLLISDRTFALEQAIRASRGDVATLDSDEVFKLVMETVRREAGGEPAMIGFSRPEEGLGLLYSLATDDGTRDALRGFAEDTEELAGFSKVLDENPLPPFDELKKYLAPTGGILVSDETGLHYTSLGLRSKAVEEAREKSDGSR
ncbi:MAG: hypothetical protein MPJ50_06140 [Pirellulales bacterium]|nr:hypothetical protein [Pirellulales bacterium]